MFTLGEMDSERTGNEVPRTPGRFETRGLPDPVPPGTYYIAIAS